MTHRPSEDGPLDFRLGIDPPLDASLIEDDVAISCDPSKVSINTPRMWTLSLLFAMFGSSINLFFSLRYPSVSISPIIALLLAHPLGLLWDTVFSTCVDHEYRLIFAGSTEATEESSPLLAPADGEPNRHPRQPKSAPKSKWQKWKAWLAQGRWNEKEHCCVFIASNVSFGFAFATDVGIPSITQACF
jgi:hypothetical protein